SLWYGDQIAPPAASTMRGTEPPYALNWRPAVHGETDASRGTLCGAVVSAVRYTVGIVGASFCRIASVRQSNDWIVPREAMPALRITPSNAAANAAGGSVWCGSSGESLVSMLKRTVVFP